MAEALADNEPTHLPREALSNHRLTASAVLLSVMITVLWGTNPTALKIALGQMPGQAGHGLPPIGAAGLRFAVAALGVWLWCGASGVSARPRSGEWPWLAVLAAFFVVQIATFSLGVSWGTASHSIVILHTYPFFVVALAHFLIPGDRATPGRVAGLVAAFSGIAVLFAGEWGQWRGSQFRGDATQLFSAFVLGAQIVATKHALARVAPDRVVLWQMAIGAPVFIAFSLAFEQLAAARPGAASIAAIAYQGVVIGALCFTIWTWLIRHYAASRVAIFGFIAPLIGVFLSALVLHEPLSPVLLASASLVAVGIVLANLW